MLRKSVAQARFMCQYSRYMRLSTSVFYVSLAMLIAAVAQPASLTIDRAAGPARIGVSGVVGQDYTLQSTANLTNWDFLLRLSLTNSPQNWFDASSVLLPTRFYRAVE